MNKLLLTLMLFISGFSLAKGQEYLRIIKDVQLEGTNFFKGEIYLINEEGKGPHRFSFLLGDKKHYIGANVEKLTTPPKDKSALKNILIKLTKNNLVHVDLNPLGSIDDTIWVIPALGERIPLLNNKEVTLDSSKTGNSIRLLIPNTLVLSYIVNELEKMPAHTLDQQKGTEDSDSGDQKEQPARDKDSNGGLYIFIIGVLAMLGFGVVWFLKKRKNGGKKLKNIHYDGSPLSEFANIHFMDLEELIKLNRKFIDKSYSNFTKGQKKEVHNDLLRRGVYLLVYSAANQGLMQHSSSGSAISNTSEQVIEDDWEKPVGRSVQIPLEKTRENPDNYKKTYEKNEDVSNLIRQMESRILDAIRQTGAKSDTSNEVTRLNKELSTLENEIANLTAERRTLDANLGQMQADKINAETRSQEFSAAKNDMTIELNRLKEKINAVEYLKTYAESVSSCLLQCEQILQDAYAYFNKLSIQHPQQSFIISPLLVQFQDAVNTLPLGSWSQIVQGIMEAGVIVNKRLIRSFSQLNSDQEKQKEFKRLLFSEMLYKYSSAVLILAEALRNADRFQIPPVAGSDARQIFEAHITRLVNKLRAVNLVVKYVPLFRNFEEYLSEVQSIDKTRSLAYRQIDDLEKGFIAEIASYGMSTEFEDTKTTIILA